MKKYNKIPLDLGVMEIDVQEYFKYIYLPIKLAGQHEITVEKRLHPFLSLIGRVGCHYIGEFGLDNYTKSYVYLTAKHEYQKEGQGFNREGWHSDGFGTDDINYIWSNRQPTIFNNSDFILSDDDELSMQQMAEQADPANNFAFCNNSIVMMDQFSIHRVGEIEPGNRCFVKISFSLDKYNLAGNSVNHELDYSWDYCPRKVNRNIPQNNV